MSDSGDYRGLPVVSLINIGTEAAFHGAPAAGLVPLRRAVERATDLAELAQSRWLLGVCLASLGRFREAREVLEPLIVESSFPDRWIVLAHTTVASTLRQEHRHAEAQRHDEQAAAIANESTAFDARIGLAADAVGQLNLSAAQEHWGMAMAVAIPEWRQQVRLAWVDAEIALMRRRASHALTISLAAAETAQLAQAPRHRAKSLLFAGVAAKEAGATEQAKGLLSESLLISEKLELEPLQRPAREALATL